MTIKFKSMNMAKFILLMNWLILPQITHSQQFAYESYYEKVGEASYLTFKGKYKEAFDLYSEAFKSNYPFLGEINSSLEIVQHLDLRENAALFHLVNAIKLLRGTFFSDNVLARSKLNESDRDTLMSHFNYVDESYFLVPDQDILDMTSKVDFLLEYDQSIRRVSGLSRACKDQLLFHIDSLNYKHVIEMVRDTTIKRERLGNYFLKLHWLLLHASVQLGLTDELIALLEQKVLHGQYNNKKYGDLIDRYYDWYLESPQIYGSWPYYHKLERGIIDCKNLDKRRASIGLIRYDKYKEMKYISYSCP